MSFYEKKNIVNVIFKTWHHPTLIYTHAKLAISNIHRKSTIVRSASTYRSLRLHGEIRAS